MREISRAGHDGLPPIAGLWENAPAMGHWCHQIAQSADARSGTLQPMQLFLLGSVFESVSRAFEATIARCPGRFTSQKALAFRRLKLTEQAIAITPVNAIGLDELAGIARYRRDHFVCVYRHVFGESPRAQIERRAVHIAQHELRGLGLDPAFAKLHVSLSRRRGNSATRRHQTVRTPKC
jgi:hypothetical protein